MVGQEVPSATCTTKRVCRLHRFERMTGQSPPPKTSKAIQGHTILPTSPTLSGGLDEKHRNCNGETYERHHCLLRSSVVSFSSYRSGCGATQQRGLGCQCDSVGSSALG